MILGLYGGNGKEHGNYFNGFYRVYGFGFRAMHPVVQLQSWKAAPAGSKQVRPPVGAGGTPVTGTSII